MILANDEIGLCHRSLEQVVTGPHPSSCQLIGSRTVYAAIDQNVSDKSAGALSAFVRAGLVASTGEARRQIRGGGLRVNDATLGDEKALITRDALNASGVVKLSLGRKKHVLLRAV